MLTVRRSLGGGSLRAQRGQRKGSSVKARDGGTEAFKQGNQSSSSNAHRCMMCKMGLRQYCLDLRRPLRKKMPCESCLF